MKKLKKTEIIELNEAYNKVLGWFFSYPLTPISLTDLAAQLKISKKTTSKIVGQLIKEEFLIKEEIGRVWRIYCNQQHIYNYTRKIGYNLSLVYQALYESGAIGQINEITGNPKVIILFGSYRKGDDTDKSDIDLAIEVTGNEEPKIICLGVLPNLGYRKNIPLNLHIFSRNKIDINLFSNISNGIVLQGFLEVHP